MCTASAPPLINTDVLVPLRLSSSPVVGMFWTVSVGFLYACPSLNPANLKVLVLLVDVPCAFHAYTMATYIAVLGHRIILSR